MHRRQNKSLDVFCGGRYVSQYNTVQQTAIIWQSKGVRDDSNTKDGGILRELGCNF